MKCVQCGKSGCVETTDEYELIPWGDQTIGVHVPVRHCYKCKFSYTDWEGEEAREAAIQKFKDGCTLSAVGRTVKDLEHEIGEVLHQIALREGDLRYYKLQLARYEQQLREAKNVEGTCHRSDPGVGETPTGAIRSS